MLPCLGSKAFWRLARSTRLFAPDVHWARWRPEDRPFASREGGLASKVEGHRHGRSNSRRTIILGAGSCHVEGASHVSPEAHHTWEPACSRRYRSADRPT